jgi:hypothetical protein
VQLHSYWVSRAISVILTSTPTYLHIPSPTHKLENGIPKSGRPLIAKQVHQSDHMARQQRRKTVPWGPIQQSSQSTAGFRLHLLQICCPKSIFFEPNWQDFSVQHPKHALTVHGWGCSQGCTKPITPGNSKLQLRYELTAVSPPPPRRRML